ncbi:DNA polymerase subunit gamma-2, mitochondrial isoform X1 [Pelobates cultripes]|uniref:DNA polymerase subunit gamma-2, mitochondrial isoform X1 n=1 Tax=Pelobates cultripes TaxID=61616 RepID=A0AAD1S3A8_PELCU|nr:DNA polymerase subunit gamma-2, mitochondrial isoform X1 [Pelobates cultripes]
MNGAHNEAWITHGGTRHQIRNSLYISLNMLTLKDPFSLLNSNHGSFWYRKMYMETRRHFISGDNLTKTSLLQGFHSLGPLGKELKKNLVTQWWNSIVLYREEVLAIDTLYHIPLQAHASKNPLVTICSESWKSHLQGKDCTQDKPVPLLENTIRQNGVLREDLLYGALQQYVSCLDLMNKKLPFGLAEIGKCFNPIPDKNVGKKVSSIGEQTLASLTWFSSAKTASQWRDYWLRHRLQWWQKFAQSPSSFSTSDHQDDQGRKVSEIQYRFPWGKEPIESLCSKDDSTLLQMHPGNNTQLHGRDGRKSVIPYVLWVSGNLERGLLAYLSDALQLSETSRQTKDLRRQVLKFHPALTPFKVAVDMVKGPAMELRLVCQGMASELRENGISVWPGYSETSHVPLEKLFTRYDEMGILFTALVSESTLENGLLQLRNRDTTLKETMHVSKVRHFLEQYITAAKNL